MAERPDVKTRRLTRDKLALFLPNQESIKALENMSLDVGETLPDAIEGMATNADTLLSAQGFLPRGPAHHEPRIDGDAQRILSTQIFGG